MTHLYSCRHAGDEYRITKFDAQLNVESSYLCTLIECECPAGERATCRHRQMLPKFLQRKAVDTEWFLDFDRGGWVQVAVSEPAEAREGEQAREGAQHIEEQDCPGHVASQSDPKICGICGVHIDSLRSDEDLIEPHGPTVTTAGFDPADGGSIPPAVTNWRRGL